MHSNRIHAFYLIMLYYCRLVPAASTEQLQDVHEHVHEIQIQFQCKESAHVFTEYTAIISESTQFLRIPERESGENDNADGTQQHPDSRGSNEQHDDFNYNEYNESS